MKILITGGAGFIGTEIVKQLFERKDCEITVLDLMTEQIHGKEWKKSYLYGEISDKCTFIKGDIRDLGCVKETVKGKDVIIHLAAETGTGQSMYQINRYNDVNVMGMSNIFQAISLCGDSNSVKKIILASSRAVYGEGKYSCPKCGIVYPRSRSKERMVKGDFGFYCDNCGSKLTIVPTTEDSNINPSSLYAYTKYAQEMMTQTMCSAFKINYTIFRFQNVYGVGQSLKNPYTGILSVFSSLMLENKSINIFEDGRESRDFVNVKDVAQGVIQSIFTDESNGEIINLGSGINTSVIDVANMLRQYYNSQSVINITGDFRIGDIAHNKADITKAKHLLGYNPRISLEKGLEDFCLWVKNQEIDNSRYEKSLSEMENNGMFVRKE